MRSEVVAVFYISGHDAPDRTAVNVGGRMVYIRAEVAARHSTLDDALVEARPREDESVMNSHWIGTK